MALNTLGTIRVEIGACRPSVMPAVGTRVTVRGSIAGDRVRNKIENFG